MADDAAAVIAHLDAGPAHVFGMSMGGMIAQHVAARHPGLTRSLISVMSSSGDPSLPGPTPEAAAMLVAWLIRCVTFVYRAEPKMMPAVLGWIAGISLIDMFYLTLLNRPDLAAIAFGAFAVTIWSHRRIMGT